MTLLSGFVLAFLPKSKSFFFFFFFFLNFMASVTIHSDFGDQEKKLCHYFHFSPSVCHEVVGLDAMILVF